MKKLFTILMLCAGLSAFAGTVNVSFQLEAIDSTGKAVDTTQGAWIVGNFNSWKFSTLEDLGDHVLQFDTTLNANDTINFYFILVNSWDSAGNQDWNYYKKYREYPDTASTTCNPSYAGWKGDRWAIVPAHDTVITVKWGVCGESNTAVRNTTKQSFYLSAYPNPAKGAINVQVPYSDGITTYDVFDLTGKMIKSVKTSDTNFSLDLSGVPANIYMLKATNKNSSVSRKIVLQ